MSERSAALDPGSRALGPSSRPIGLYLHVPFCAARCSYCNFYFTTERAPQQEFEAQLVRAVEAALPALRDSSAGGWTVALGGGTPSRIASATLHSIMDLLRGALGAPLEASLEANPEDLTPAALTEWKAAGISRLTVGVQTLDDRLLLALNRQHSADDARRAIERAAAAGFENLGADLIFALPGQTRAQAEADLREVARWPLAHLSHYALELEATTRLGAEAARGLHHIPDDDWQADLYQSAYELLAGAGFARYEVSNYARPGFESRHNSLYWTDCDYLGLGPSAASRWQGSYWRELPDLRGWLRAAHAGTERRVDLVTPAPRERLRDALAMGLRRNAGVQLTDWWHCHLPDTPLPALATSLAILIDRRELQWDGKRLSIPAENQFLTEGIVGRTLAALGLL